MPETVIDEHNLEIVGRVRDTCTRVYLDDCQRVRKPVKVLAFRLGGWMSGGPLSHAPCPTWPELDDCLVVRFRL